jgi:hypothetical protein
MNGPPSYLPSSSLTPVPWLVSGNVDEMDCPSPEGLYSGIMTRHAKLAIFFFYLQGKKLATLGTFYSIISIYCMRMWVHNADDLDVVNADQKPGVTHSSPLYVTNPRNHRLLIP